MHHTPDERSLDKNGLHFKSTTAKQNQIRLSFDIIKILKYTEQVLILAVILFKTIFEHHSFYIFDFDYIVG